MAACAKIESTVLISGVLIVGCRIYEITVRGLIGVPLKASNEQRAGRGAGMKRKGWSFRESDGKAFAVENKQLRVFRVFANHVWEVKDSYTRTTIRLRAEEISTENACSISRFNGDLEATLRAEL